MQYEKRTAGSEHWTNVSGRELRHAVRLAAPRFYEDIMRAVYQGGTQQIGHTFYRRKLTLTSTPRPAKKPRRSPRKQPQPIRNVYDELAPAFSLLPRRVPREPAVAADYDWFPLAQIPRRQAFSVSSADTARLSAAFAAGARQISSDSLELKSE